MTTIKAVIHPIIGKGQYRHPLQYYLVLAVAILVDSWNFSSARFLTNPKISPSTKVYCSPSRKLTFLPYLYLLEISPLPLQSMTNMTPVTVYCLDSDLHLCVHQSSSSVILYSLAVIITCPILTPFFFL